MKNREIRSPLTDGHSVKVIHFFLLLLFIGGLAAIDRTDAAEKAVQKQEFRNPPAGYGEVPFWWWTGEELNAERLIWQLEQLHRAGISGVQVNYAHRDQRPWLTYPPEPEIFSDSWWDIYDTVAAACAERGMGIGVSGYTIDWQKTPGNLFSRIVYNNPETVSRNILLEKRIPLRKGERFSEPISKDPNRKTVAALFYPRQGETLNWPEGADLLTGSVEGVDFDGSALSGAAPEEGELWLYAAESVPDTLNPLHPDSGARVIRCFFAPFEEHSPTGTAEGLNYFFQDELQIGTGPLLWCDDLPEEFQARKGYSLFEALPVFFDENASNADKGVKYRLDWYDVRVRLAEERYFQPIFDWHNSRGLIYACDPASRGCDPSEFCDYFSAIRWYTAPGHDTPGGSADFIKNRVSSSIAHFYHRPRVWLEGYHSLGWGAAPERLFNATCENFIFGANLLNLHGLYYSTCGGWWEWAPPCYHFRMPYWRDFSVFLRYFERLSYVMSQGRQKADILIYYPVSEYQGAGNRGHEAVSYAFAAAKQLAGAYYNVLFVDDDSLARAAVAGDKLVIDGEPYSALILPNISTIRWRTLEQLCRWQEEGGMVIALKTLPAASDRAGKNDPLLAGAAARLFADTRRLIDAEPEDLTPLVELIAAHLPRDVEPQPAAPIIFQHRTGAAQDIYVVKGAVEGTHLRFRAEGTAEQWDPWTGETKEILQYDHPAGGVTEIVVGSDAPDMQIIIFDRTRPARFDSVRTDLGEISSITPPAAPEESWRAVGTSNTPGAKTVEIACQGETHRLTGTAPVPPAPKEFAPVWESEIVPVLDNRYGDFRLPIEEEYLGAEARRFLWHEEGKTAVSPRKEESETFGFGPKFLRLGPLPDDLTQTQKEELGARIAEGPFPPESVELNGVSYDWTAYSFSWREGIEGNPGHEGYHGLKELLDNRFIGLGKNEEGLNETLFVPSEKGNVNYLLTWVHAIPAEEGSIVIKTEGAFPAAASLAGTPIDADSRFQYSETKHPLLLRYDLAGRCAFALIDESAPKRTEEPTPLSMVWFEMPGRLDFDIYPDDGPMGVYRFLSPPGLESAVISAKAPFTVTAGGKEFRAEPLSEDDSPEKGSCAPAGLDGSRRYRVRFGDGVKTPRTVEIRARADGARGGAFFPEPIRLECGIGEMPLGNWNELGVLETFSGGIVYRQRFELSESELQSRPWLDLGGLSASARVTVNGIPAGTLVTSPWQLDISGQAHAGENILEIEIRNTLSNHYRTIPTRYRGDSPSGLFGPVRIFYRPETKLSSD